MNCSFEGCTGEALFGYVWAWGDSGVCCERHRFILGQQSQRLGRAVTITSLDPGAPKPVTRDERIGYQARILALEEELQDVHARGLTLHEHGTELGRQLRTLTAQNQTLESELQAHRERVAGLDQELADTRTAHAKAGAEVLRLERLLAAYELPDIAPLDSPPAPAHTP